MFFKNLLSFIFKDIELDYKNKIEKLESLNSYMHDQMEEMQNEMLDYKLLKAYVNDDEAILELLEAQEKIEKAEREVNVSAEYWMNRYKTLHRSMEEQKHEQNEPLVVYHPQTMQVEVRGRFDKYSPIGKAAYESSRVSRHPLSNVPYEERYNQYGGVAASWFNPTLLAHSQMAHSSKNQATNNTSDRIAQLMGIIDA